MDLKEIEVFREDIGLHWYYWAKAKAVSKWLGDTQPKAILDVGAGSGFFSSYLLERSSAQEAWCVDINYEADSDTTHSGKPLHFRKSVEQVDADLVLFMDVLEHVEDDAGLLMEYAAKVPKGAKILVSVPAFKFLWSGHDVFLGHYRRYTLKEVQSVLKKAGLSLIDGGYFYGFVFPIAASIRMMQNIFSKGSEPKSQMQKHSPLVNSILKAMCAAELPVMRYNKFAGLTVFCLAEKV